MQKVTHLSGDDDRQAPAHTKAEQLRIALVDDYPIIRDGLRKLIDEQPDMQVIAEGGAGADALKIASEFQPDIILLDINLPDRNGIDVTRELKAQHKLLEILLFTAHDDAEQSLYALRAGANGYCVKDIEPALLLQNIRRVAHGSYVIQETVYSQKELEAWMARSLPQFRGSGSVTATDHVTPLSARELEILEQVVQGRSNKEIAVKLGISHQTVKNHMTSIFEKLSVTDRTQAAMIAIQRGWVQATSNETQPHNVTRHVGDKLRKG
jgi:two-component system response regulator DegU